MYGHEHLPIQSMYGIFTYIWLIFMVNVGKSTIHGSYGLALGAKREEVRKPSPENALFFLTGQTWMGRKCQRKTSEMPLLGACRCRCCGCGCCTCHGPYGPNGHQPCGRVQESGGRELYVPFLRKCIAACVGFQGVRMQKVDAREGAILGVSAGGMAPSVAALMG